MSKYVKIKFKTSDGKNHIWWAIPLNKSGKIWSYKKVTKEGDETIGFMRRDGVFVEKTNLLYCMADEIINEKPARMNNKYGELEVVSD